MWHFLAECFIIFGQWLFATLVIMFLALVVFVMIPNGTDGGPGEKDDVE